MNEKVNLNEFISIDMFMSLTGCTVLVCGLVQILKGFANFSPLWLNLICSLFVTIVRIIFKDDFSPKGVLLGIIQIIPIMLGSTGIYEFTKNILK